MPEKTLVESASAIFSGALLRLKPSRLFPVWSLFLGAGRVLRFLNKRSLTERLYSACSGGEFRGPALRVPVCPFSMKEDNTLLGNNLPPKLRVKFSLRGGVLDPTANKG
jgi:hypothetical protein